MLTLDSKLTLNAEAIKAPNLCDRFSKDDLAKIGSAVWEGFDRDLRSRASWEQRTIAAMKLAMQITSGKNFPWPDCSNVAFPLVTIAALQFHARAYPTIIQGNDVVKCRVIGEDPKGEKKARAARISSHMSWQVLEEDAAWEEQQDKLLINIPIVGTAFKKSYFDPSRGHNVSETVLAKDLVLDYWAKSVEDCQRKTHMIPLYRNEVYERVKRGVFNDVLDSGWFKSPILPTTTTQQAAVDSRQGVTPPGQADDSTPVIALEQHVAMDLDGDGYAEPYIITCEQSSHEVLRIVTRFDSDADIEQNIKKEIIKIRGWEYFTKYPFIPSPDGGIYDVGFGILLGPLNESTNTLINQLIDAGTMQTTAGGFLGRGAKIRGGVYSFSPFEWKRVDSSVDDLNKAIFPLPVKEPSSVLFNLLGLLINYTNRVSGSTDLMVGENVGQNTPAETSRALVAEGTKIYSAIFKRVWRSMKEEFKKLYLLNALNMPLSRTYGNNQKALREDYLGNPDDVVPVADPNLSSESMQMAQVKLIKESSMATPGYDIEAVERRFLKSLRVDGIEEIYPGIEKMPPGKNPKLAIEEMKVQGRMVELQQERVLFAAQLMEDQRVNNAKIVELQASAMKAVADIEGDARDREINVINTAIGLLKLQNERSQIRIDAVLRSIELKQAAQEARKEAA